MMNGWTTLKLKEACSKIGSGATPRGGKETYLADGISLIRSQNVLDFNFSTDGLAHINDEQANQLANVCVEANDVLLNITGDSVARVCQAPRSILPARVNQHVAIIRTDPLKLVPELLKYYLLNPSFKLFMLSMASAGATRNALTKGMIEDFQITVPKQIQEQKAIAKILSAFDDKIELNRRMNATLERSARALFKAWFVDFEPVHANHENRPSTSASPEIAKLFPSTLENGLPKGWQKKPFVYFLDLINERVAATPAKDEERYIALDDMPSKSIDLSKFRKGSEVNSSIIRFKENDILFGSMRPYFHKVGVAPFPGITRTTTFVLRPKAAFFKSFVLFHLFSEEVIEFSTTSSVGSTIPYVKWETLGNYKVPFPTENIMQLFEATVWNCVQKISVNGRENNLLAALRDSLLPRLVSGRIRAREIEKEISDTLREKLDGRASGL